MKTFCLLSLIMIPFVCGCLISILDSDSAIAGLVFSSIVAWFLSFYKAFTC